MKLGLGPPSPAGLSRWACCATRAASWSAFNAAARASAAATSISCALAGLATGAGGSIDGALGFTGAGAASTFFLGGIGFADTLDSLAVVGAAADGALGADGPAAKASFNRLATGASTVLDADLTNSPISLSLASTFLLSTPSSFASS
jgi:hypothetical protein